MFYITTISGDIYLVRKDEDIVLSELPHRRLLFNTIEEAESVLENLESVLPDITWAIDEE